MPELWQKGQTKYPENMMLLKLICFDCIMEQINNGVPHKTSGSPISTPLEQVNNSGIYDVKCSKGHNSKTIIVNIDFEILFDYGLNAIIDGYYREAVSSLTSSMERYFEFFIKAILRNSKLQFDDINKIWKNVSNQSERQLGAYIFLYSQTFGDEPLLLNTNKEVPFRNSVIHKGYLPSKDETIEYAKTILNIIETSLIKLKTKFPESTLETFDFYNYYKIGKEHFTKIKNETGIEQNYASVNIMTTIDIINGREINSNDSRIGNIEQIIENILKDRKPTTTTLLKDKTQPLK